MDPFAILFPLLLLLTAAVIFLCARLPYRADSPDHGWGWQSGTRFFLVLLRLAIGWHFLIEGIDKLKTPNWSSEAYLRESIGPLAPTFRSLAGDPLKDRLSPGPNGEFPDALAREWDNYFEAFKSHYEPTGDKAELAKTKLDQEKKDTLHWLTAPKAVKVPRKHLTYSRDMTVPERIAAYEKLEEELRSIESVDIPTYGKDAFARYKDVKADIARIRTELKTDLGQRTTKMKTALKDVLSAEQKQMPPVAEPLSKPLGDYTLLDWSDFVVKWGTAIVGGLLLAGLFTRTACIGGAMFLLLFFLAMPPLPGWPEPLRAEGHYLWINKNIIEMLALLALATTRSGRWVGLDGLIFGIRALWRPNPETPARHSESAALNGPREPAVSSKEMSHGT